MKLDSLRVLHLSKSQMRRQFNAEGSSLASLDLLPACYFETCQRSVWVLDERAPLSVFSFWIGQGAQLFQGQAAYRFLLRWACGLESEVLGETDIFGQIKEAWRKVELKRNPSLLGLSSWIQRIFEDTKEIRTQYLQNLGGSSYGTLVRKWMKDQGHAEGPILLVGAGQLAHSVAPALLDSELWLWNRDPIRLNALHDSLVERPGFKRLKKIEVQKNQGKNQEEAWKAASRIVLCIPVDEQGDAQRIQWIQQGNSRGCSVIHLGARREDCGAWCSLKEQLGSFACLDDLFALQKSLSNFRSVQIAQAEKACEERAQLRALGVSLSIPHGWEDLACFA